MSGGRGQGSTDGLSREPTGRHQSRMQDQALRRLGLEMVTVGTEGATGRRIKRFGENEGGEIETDG